MAATRECMHPPGASVADNPDRNGAGRGHGQCLLPGLVVYACMVHMHAPGRLGVHTATCQAVGLCCFANHCSGQVRVQFLTPVSSSQPPHIRQSSACVGDREPLNSCSLIVHLLQIMHGFKCALFGLAYNISFPARALSYGLLLHAIHAHCSVGMCRIQNHCQSVPQTGVEA